MFRWLRDAGFDYFKLDFLYAGALAGRRHRDVTGVAAYRSGPCLVRDAIGPEGYLLGCGAPILPSVGLVDAMRVSPDTYHPTEPEDEQRRLRGRTCVVARAWQHGRFWVNDPDCLVARRRSPPDTSGPTSWTGTAGCAPPRTGSPNSTSGAWRLPGDCWPRHRRQLPFTQATKFPVRLLAAVRGRPRPSRSCPSCRTARPARPIFGPGLGRVQHRMCGVVAADATHRSAAAGA